MDELFSSDHNITPGHLDESGMIQSSPASSLDHPSSPHSSQQEFHQEFRPISDPESFTLEESDDEITLASPLNLEIPINSFIEDPMIQSSQSDYYDARTSASATPISHHNRVPEADHQRLKTPETSRSSKKHHHNPSSQIKQKQSTLKYIKPPVILSDNDDDDDDTPGTEPPKKKRGKAAILDPMEALDALSERTQKLAEIKEHGKTQRYEMKIGLMKQRLEFQMAQLKWKKKMDLERLRANRSGSSQGRNNIVERIQEEDEDEEEDDDDDLLMF
jgi:hypothetical protein